MSNDGKIFLLLIMFFTSAYSWDDHIPNAVMENQDNNPWYQGAKGTVEHWFSGIKNWFKPKPEPEEASENPHEIPMSKLVPAEPVEPIEETKWEWEDIYPENNDYNERFNILRQKLAEWQKMIWGNGNNGDVSSHEDLQVIFLVYKTHKTAGFQLKKV